jgi:hypothetical protein
MAESYTSPTLPLARACLPTDTHKRSRDKENKRVSKKKSKKKNLGSDRGKIRKKKNIHIGIYIVVEKEFHPLV